MEIRCGELSREVTIKVNGDLVDGLGDKWGLETFDITEAVEYYANNYIHEISEDDEIVIRAY